MISVKNYTPFQNTVYVWRHTARTQKGVFVLLALTAVCTAFQTLLLAFLPAAVLSLFESSNGSASGVLTVQQALATVLHRISVILACFLASSLVSTWLEHSFEQWRYFSARFTFLTESGKKVLYMPYHLYEKTEILDLCEKAVEACSSNTVGIEGLCRTTKAMCADAVLIASTMAAVTMMNPLMALLTVCLAILHFIITDRTRRTEKKQVWDVLVPINRRLNYFSSMAADFSFAKDIRLFGMQKFLERKQKKEAVKAHRLVVKSKNMWIISGAASSSLGIIQELALYAYLVYRNSTGMLTVAQFTLYAGMIRSFSASLQSFLDKYADLRNESRQINDFRSLFDLTTESEATAPLPAAPYTVTFDHVSYRYPGQTGCALHDVCITLTPGSRLAVVGLNGAGKTTFVKLLCRLYEPTEGKILLNGTDISTIPRNTYCSLIAPVFQDASLYAFTLEENISMKRHQETDSKKARQAAVTAGLSEKINSLAKGMDSNLLRVLYDDGIELSGGETQKLSFARALYKDAPLLVLDEPTAALDPLAEEKMYRTFNTQVSRNGGGKKTVIYISHRLSSTQFCDNIAFFKDGRIAEYGSHEQLVKLNGGYADLFATQAQYYREQHNEKE